MPRFDTSESFLLFLRDVFADFYRSEGGLIQCDISKRPPEAAIVFRIALWMMARLRLTGLDDNIYLDCFSDRFNGREVDRSIRIPNDITFVNEIHPDVILHERESGNNNIFALEFKITGKTGTRRAVERDKRKLEVLTNPRYFNYRFGAKVVLCQRVVKLDMFEGGKQRQHIEMKVSDLLQRAAE